MSSKSVNLLNGYSEAVTHGHYAMHSTPLRPSVAPKTTHQRTFRRLLCLRHKDRRAERISVADNLSGFTWKNKSPTGEKFQHLKVLGARMVIHSQYPQVSNVTVRNLVAMATRRQGFVHLCDDSTIWQGWLPETILQPWRLQILRDDKIPVYKVSKVD
jgi:hypothetical protein